MHGSPQYLVLYVLQPAGNMFSVSNSKLEYRYACIVSASNTKTAVGRVVAIRSCVVVTPPLIDGSELPNRGVVFRARCRAVAMLGLKLDSRAVEPSRQKVIAS